MDGDEQDRVDGDEQDLVDGDEQDRVNGDEQDRVDGDEQDHVDDDHHTKLLNSITGCPREDGILQFALPVCAPYTTTSSYK